MIRNWDTIREILIKFEEKEPGKGSLELNDFPKDKAHEYSYHVELLIEADLIHGKMQKTYGLDASDFTAQRLTWSGHEFLDAIRSDTVWNKAKESFVKNGLSMTFDLVKSITIDISTSLLKSSIGT